MMLRYHLRYASMNPQDISTVLRLLTQLSRLCVVAPRATASQAPEINCTVVVLVRGTLTSLHANYHQSIVQT
jgi:hypothetical protein